MTLEKLLQEVTQAFATLTASEATSLQSEILMLTDNAVRERYIADGWTHRSGMVRLDEYGCGPEIWSPE